MNYKFTSEQNLDVINKYLNTFTPIEKKFNTEMISVETEKPNNIVLHVGIGGFHRSHQAFTIHKSNEFLDKKDKWGIIGFGLCDWDEEIYKNLKKQFYQYTLVSRSNSFSNVHIMTIIKDFFFVPHWKKDTFFSKVTSDIKIISMTITEKGYFINSDNTLDFENESIQEDLTSWNNEIGLSKPKTIFGFLCSYFLILNKKNLPPITVMSCDNLSKNGDLCRSLCIEFADKISKSLSSYIKKEIQFPNSMVDRITPYTTNTDRFVLQINYNIVDRIPVVCESFISWIIENKFSSIRPPWIQLPFVKETNNVLAYEEQKLLLLNSSHSLLAYLALLHKKSIFYEFMMDKNLVKKLKKYMDELTIYLSSNSDLNHEEYKVSIIKRFENYYIKDELCRIAEDGTQKLKNTLTNCLLFFYKKDETPDQISFLLALFIYYMKYEKKKIKDNLAKKILKLISGKKITIPIIQKIYSLIFPSFFQKWTKIHKKILFHYSYIKNQS